MILMYMYSSPQSPLEQDRTRHVPPSIQTANTLNAGRTAMRALSRTSQEGVAGLQVMVTG